MNINEYIKEINKASRYNKLVFFVGAGVSKLSGYPKWSELVDRFYEELYGPNAPGNYSSDELLRIPQIYYDSLEENEKHKYYEIIEKAFKEEKEPNNIHRKILSLNPFYIITTNYYNLLEKTCWERGKYYTIISSDKNVSGDVSSRYLLKVHGDIKAEEKELKEEDYKNYDQNHPRDIHGDIKAEKIVLKEEDYINYNQNHPLISNLIKTIVATYTIVFIGYNLRDYNINLLLNWVKQLQKKNGNYKEPFFIRTEHEPIEDSDRRYYEKKGLRIIDSASLLKDSEKNDNDYVKRYNAVMDRLIDSRNNTEEMSDSDVIELIYNKIKPLFNLKSLRKCDLKYAFDNDYIFNEQGDFINYKYILDNNHDRKGYFERFDSIDIDLISEDVRIKYNVILKFLSDIKNSKYKEVNNPVFHANFDEIEQAINSGDDNIEFLYKKAFYLVNMGEWEQGYELYTEIISKAVECRNYRIYFMSQINRYLLYELIKQTKKHLDSIGILTFGTHHKPFSEKFINNIDDVLKNFDLNDLFLSMPPNFQEEYKILKILSDRKFLYDDTVKLFESTKEIRKDMSKDSYSARSFTEQVKTEVRLYETIRFLYDNHLLFIMLDEFKNYVIYAMTLILEKKYYDMDLYKKGNILFDESQKSSGNDTHKFYIDYFNFVIISKTFNVEDIEHLEIICNNNKEFQFKKEDNNKIEEYLLRLISKFDKCVVDKDILLNFILIQEIIPAIYFAKYITLSEECIAKLINTILYSIPLNALDIGKKYLLCDRLAEKNKLPDNTIKLIEKFLLEQAQKYKYEIYSELTSNGYSSSSFALLIKKYYPEYISNDISSYVLNLEEPSKSEIDYLYELSKILTPESRQYLFSKKSIHYIIDCYLAGDFESIEDEIIINYVSNSMSVIKNNRENGVPIVEAGDLRLIAFWYFMGKVKIEKPKEYTGIVDEYDMFVEPESFDYSKFKPEWLKSYPEELLNKISENNHMRKNILAALKEKLVDSKDHVYMNILLRYFVKC